MEPCAPGTEDEQPIMYSTLNKKKNEELRILNLKGSLKNGRYENIFELNIVNGVEVLYCKACECPVMGRVFQHETGKRHKRNLLEPDNPTDPLLNDEESDEPTEILEVAPGEPVPPGFEDDVRRTSIIQVRLDKFKVGPLLALEYLIELQDNDPSKEPLYLCIMCDKKGDPRTILTHLASYNHISQYLQKHFPTCWRALAPYSVKQYKKNWHTALGKIAEAIELKFGRLKPFPIENNKFEKNRMHYIQLIARGPHFSEKSGYTFEELVIPEELVKNSEDEKSFDPSTVNVWGTYTSIQKPFKKRSPSPPVVNIPTKKNKGNAQTNPRSKVQEPAFVVAKPNEPAVKLKQEKPAETIKHLPGQTYENQQPIPWQSRKKSPSISSFSDKSNDSNHDRRITRERNKPGFGREKAPAHKHSNLPYRRRRSISPRRRSISPRRRSISPRRRSISPRRRSISPRRRSISPRRRSISPRRRSPGRRRSPSQRQRPSPRRRSQSPSSRHSEQERERLRKIEEFKKYGRAIENDMMKTLKQHEKNPEKHPQYNEEWKKFWNKRYKELKAEGVDVQSYDFKPEWIQFWNKRMVEIHSDELRNRKEALRKRLDLPEEMSPIKFKINAVPVVIPDKISGPKLLPMAAQPDQDNEIIVIDDKEDDKKYERNRDRYDYSRSSPKRLYVQKSRDRSPVKREQKSPERYKRALSHHRSKTRERSYSLERLRIENASPISDTSHTSRHWDNESVGSQKRSRSRSKGSPSYKRKLVDTRTPSRERSWEKKGTERVRADFRESSFERDVRARERIRTVADLPWERQTLPPIGYRNPYMPPSVMRDVTRAPIGVTKRLPPDDDDDDGEVNVVDVLRLLTAIEERLGSLGPKVINLLAQALAMEKNEANSSESLLDNDAHCVLFETVKEKLKGQMLAGLVDPMQERAFKKAIKKIASLIHTAGQRKRQREKLLPKMTSDIIPPNGPVDKVAIAKQIANALIAQGKTDVSQKELEQLINTVVAMAEASRNSNKVTNGSVLQMLEMTKTNQVVRLEKLTEPLTPSPGRTTNMENLSDSDLQTLLQNFKDLSTDEQHNLINYLKKLEYQEPDRVEKLRKFVNLDQSKQDADITKTDLTENITDDEEQGDDDSEKESVLKKNIGRSSPFAKRTGGGNPISDDTLETISDDEHNDIKNEKEQDNSDKKEQQIDSGDEYSFEDVVKTVSKNLKDKELEHSKTVLEATMKYDKNKSQSNLSNAKDLISSLMANITKTNSNSSSIDLLGLGKAPSKPAEETVPTVDLTKLSDINMANLANIVNNVKNMSNNANNTDNLLSFEPPNTRSAPKLNFDLGQLKPALERNLNQPLVEPNLSVASNVPGRLEGSSDPVIQRTDRFNIEPDRFSGIERAYEGEGNFSDNRDFARLQNRPAVGFGSQNWGPGPMDNRGQAPIDNNSYIRGSGPLDRGHGPMDRIPGHMDRFGPIDRGSGFDRGVGPMNRGPGINDRHVGSMDRIQGPMFDRGLGPMNRGPAIDDRDIGHIGRGPIPMDRAPGPINRLPGSIDRGYGPIDRSFGPMDRGLGPMDRGPGPMDRGRGPMDRGPGPMDRGPGPMDRGPGPMDRGPGPMDRGPGPLDRGSGPMDRGPVAMDRGPGPNGPMRYGSNGPGPAPRMGPGGYNARSRAGGNGSIGPMRGPGGPGPEFRTGHNYNKW